MEKQYQIFISYRRDGGESTAKILCDKLESMGYQVFFDVESLRSGDFNTALYSVIDESEDFLLVLSPNALDRCRDEKDWVRLEIEHALAVGKNIIPVMLRGFSFPDELPESVNAVRFKNGVEANYQFFDAFMEKLRSFLLSKPEQEPVKKAGKRLPVLICLVAAILIGVIVLILKNGREDLYPKTAAEKNLTNDLLYYVELNIQQLEQAAKYLDNSYQACDKYLSHADTMDRDALLAELSGNRRLLYQLNADIESSRMTEQLHDSLMDSPFSVADATAMHDYLTEFTDSCISDIYYMEYLTDPDTYMDPDVKEDVLGNYREILEEELKAMAYDTNLLLLPVTNEEALESFQQDFLPQLYYIPLQASGWSTNEDALKSDEEKSLNAISTVMDRIAVQVGEDNMELMESKYELIKQLMAEGYTEEEARKAVESLSGGTRLLTEKEAQVEELLQEKEKLLEEARVKFAPAEGDDGDLLWGKMLRFLHLGLYDEAVACVDAYREAVRDTDEYAQKYCAATVRFIRSIGRTGIDYGLIVVGYEPDMPENEQYEIGDIIIALGNAPCHNYEEYSSLRSAVGEGEDYFVTVLRAKEEGDGELEQITLLIPADSSRVLLREMTEREYE